MFKTHRTYELNTGVKNNSIAVVAKDGSLNFTVIYHNTKVVERKGLNVELYNGGWDTVSTRIVINRALEQIESNMGYLFRRKGETLYMSPDGVAKVFTGHLRIRIKR